MRKPLENLNGKAPDPDLAKPMQTLVHEEETRLPSD